MSIGMYDTHCFKSKSVTFSKREPCNIVNYNKYIYNESKIKVQKSTCGVIWIIYYDFFL